MRPPRVDGPFDNPVSAHLRITLTTWQAGQSKGRDFFGCRKLESSLENSSLASFTQKFRSTCDAAMHRTLTTGSGLAQAVSLLLDHGNEKVSSLERSLPSTAPAADPAEAEDPFWMGVMPDVSSLLFLQVLHLHAPCVVSG